MAIEVQEMDGEKVLVVKASGKLTKEDYNLFVPEVDGLIKKHGKIRIVFEMRDFHGWKLSAAWEDTKFAVRHFSDIERLAVIGEKTWQDWMTRFCRPFTKAEIRYFEVKDAEQAYDWIKNN